MSYTQQQLADLFKKLIPRASETDNQVSLTINGITINLPKNARNSQSNISSQSNSIK